MTIGAVARCSEGFRHSFPSDHRPASQRPGFMSEEERKKIKEIPEETIQIIKKVFDLMINLNDLFDIRDNYSNAQLGQITRGYAAGKRLITLSFKKIKELREGKP